jgi:uncharacterized protein
MIPEVEPETPMEETMQASTQLRARAALGTRLSPRELVALEDFLARAREVLGPELREARLFGSRARGEGSGDSDLDLALVVSSAGHRRRHQVQDLAFDTVLRHGVSVSPLVLEEHVLAELKARERRLALDLEREGIPL